MEAIASDPVRILAGEPEAICGVRALCDAVFAGQCYAEMFYNPDGSVRSLGVFPAGAGKGTALALVLDRLDIGRQQAMAVGDNLSDIPMFRHAGVSVAMGNAPDAVKREATAVAPGNDEEGVAWALETFGIA